MGTPAPAPTEGATVVTIVHAPACHFCADAQRTLAELARDFPLRVELLDWAEPRGERLMRDHRAPMYPLVLLDGVLFSSGRLPRRKLARLLATRVATVGA